MTVKLIEHKTREEWLEGRKRGLGGSEAAAIMGLNKHRSPLQVYFNHVEGNQIEETDAMHWGNKLEPVVADEYAQRNGVNFKQLSFPIFLNSDYYGAIASPDRIIEGREKGVEIKTVGFRAAMQTDSDGMPMWGDDESDFVPTEYVIQCQHYMMVTGFKEWDLAALIGGQQFRVYRLHSDNELQGAIAEAVGKFWNNIQTHTPPQPRDEDERADLLKRIKNTKNHFLDVTQKDEEILRIIDLLKEARIESASAEERLKSLENDVKTIIGDADGITWVDEQVGKRLKISWKASKDSRRIDWKGVVEAVNPSEDVLRKYSKIIPGSRSLLVPREWNGGAKRVHFEA